MEKDSVIIILSGVMWGFVGVITSQILTYKLSTYFVVEMRFIFSCVILGVGLLIFNKSQLKPKKMAISILLGICNFLTTICYYNCIKYLGSAIASVLLYSSPIMVVVYGKIKSKVKIETSLIFALALSFLGSLLCVNGGVKFSVIGIVFGLLSAVSNALVSIVGAKIGKNNIIGANFYAFLSASVIGLCFIRADNIIKLANLKVSLLFLFLSVFCTVIPYILYIGAIKKGKEGTASLLCASEPITANLIEMILLKNVNAFSIIGLVCLMVGVFMASIKNNRMVVRHDLVANPCGKGVSFDK